MKQDNRKILELDKIKEIAPYPMHHQFITGYLAFAIPPEISHEVKMITNQLLSMAKDQLITSFNLLELLVIIKFQVLPPLEKDPKASIHQLLEPFLTQISLDNTYLHRHYFEKAIHASEIVSDNLGVQCLICLTQINTSQLCYFVCGHMFHRQCFSEYAKEKIINKQIPFTCPQEGCTTQIVQEDVNQFLPKDLRDKYEDFAFHNYVEKNMEDTSWCPTPGCNAVFQFDEELTQYRCPACKKNYCLRCKCQFHQNMSCKEYQKIANLGEEDKNFMFFVKGAKFKQCPNCKFWVQKSEGCNHMTCRCKYEFCYVCGGKYQKCKCNGYEIEQIQPHFGEIRRGRQQHRDEPMMRLSPMARVPPIKREEVQEVRIKRISEIAEPKKSSFSKPSYYERIKDMDKIKEQIEERRRKFQKQKYSLSSAQKKPNEEREMRKKEFDHPEEEINRDEAFKTVFAHLMKPLAHQKQKIKETKEERIVKQEEGFVFQLSEFKPPFERKKTSNKWKQSEPQPSILEQKPKVSLFQPTVPFKTHEKLQFEKKRTYDFTMPRNEQKFQKFKSNFVGPNQSRESPKRQIRKFEKQDVLKNNFWKPEK